VQEVRKMCKKYVILAVCLALAVTLIHAPDSCGKVRAVKTFDGKVWVRIDEIEGHTWDEIAAFPGIRGQDNRQFFSVYIPFFNISVGLIIAYDNNHFSGNRICKDGVGVIEYGCHNKRSPRYDCRID
jgi:hypothetical protein